MTAMNERKQEFDRRSKTILGVDDSVEMQAILHAMITGAGFAFTAAQDGPEALAQIAAREPFSVILLDVQMPGMDGFELCQQIRKQPKGRSVPIIFLTVRNTTADVEKCKAAGGNAFIVKPFNSKTLVRHLDHWSQQSAAKPIGRAAPAPRETSAAS
jgi:CheY-like chemotaxis protein